MFQITARFSISKTMAQKGVHFTIFDLISIHALYVYCDVCTIQISIQWCSIHHFDENSVDPDQLASSEASRSGSMLFSKEGIKFNL